MTLKSKAKENNKGLDQSLVGLVPPVKARLRRSSEFGQLGPSLAKLRVTAGLTQQQLAADAGVSLKSLRKIEQGSSGVTLSTLKKLVEFLGCEIKILGPNDGTTGNGL